MPDIAIGRLRGGLCAFWPDPVTGRRRRYQLKARTRAEAEREAVQLYRDLNRSRQGLTTAMIWWGYVEDRQGRPIAKTMRYSAKAVLGHFGETRAEQITTAQCRAYVELRRGQGIADGSIWTELGHLRTALSWAQKERLIAFAPSIERPQKPRPKDRWLTHEEIERLLACTDAPHIRVAMTLMLTTACRVGAALDLTWNRVDFQAGIVDLRLPHSTTLKGRSQVPMNRMLRTTLEEAERGSLSDHVVEWSGKPVKSIRKGFESAVKRAELENVTQHTLRHTAGVHMAAAGVPMQMISQYMGHSNTAITERVYARFAPGHMKEAAAALEFGTISQASPGTRGGE